MNALIELRGFDEKKTEAPAHLEKRCFGRTKDGASWGWARNKRRLLKQTGRKMSRGSEKMVRGELSIQVSKQRFRRKKFQKKEAPSLSRRFVT